MDSSTVNSLVSFCFALYSWEQRLKPAVFANQSRNKLFVPTRHIRPLLILPMSLCNIRLPSGDTILTYEVLIIQCYSDKKKTSLSYTPQPSPCAACLVMVGKLVHLLDLGSYIGRGSVSGRSNHDEQVFWIESTQKSAPFSPGWGLDVVPTTPPCKNHPCYRNLNITVTELTVEGANQVGT